MIEIISHKKRAMFSPFFYAAAYLT